MAAAKTYRLSDGVSRKGRVLWHLRWNPRACYLPSLGVARWGHAGRGVLLVLLSWLLLASGTLGTAEVRRVPLTVTRKLIRMVAGQTADVPLSTEGLSFARAAGRLHADPPFALGRDDKGLFVVTSPSIRPGAYRISFSVTDASGQERTGSVEATVEPSPPIPQTSRPPVILLNGYDFLSLPGTCSPAGRDSTKTFGRLQEYLERDGSFVYFQDSCALGGSGNVALPIEDLGSRLGAFIQAWRYTDGTPVPRVDLITHSMGGLTARCYLSGKQRASGVFTPPADPKVRKLVLIACPNFGSGWAGTSLGIGNQLPLMRLGSQFLWDLATWNQGLDDLREVDAIAVIGNGGSQSWGDGVVSLLSASLLFTLDTFYRPRFNTRVVPYCHTSSATVLCSTNQLIAGVDSEAHLTSRIIRSFLADTDDWQRVGTAPFADAVLGASSGIYAAYKDASDRFFNDFSQLAQSRNIDGRHADSGARRDSVLQRLSTPPG